MEVLKFTIIKFENKYAILENEIFGTIQWPIKKLPDQIEIGNFIYLTASLESPDYQNSQNTNIKKLLEEIIN